MLHTKLKTGYFIRTSKKFKIFYYILNDSEFYHFECNFFSVNLVNWIGMCWVGGFEIESLKCLFHIFFTHIMFFWVKLHKSHGVPRILIKQERLTPREGLIIKCPLIHFFHDACDVILTSWNDVRQLDDDDDNDEPTLGVYIYIYIYKYNVKSHLNDDF